MGNREERGGWLWREQSRFAAEHLLKQCALGGYCLGFERQSRALAGREFRLQIE